MERIPIIGIVDVFQLYNQYLVWNIIKYDLFKYEQQRHCNGFIRRNILEGGTISSLCSTFLYT